MKAIIDQLNADVPGLGLTYDGVTASVEDTVEALEKAAKAQADEERKAEQMQTYVDLYKEQADLTQQIAEAEANLDAERQRRGMRKDDVTGDWVNGMGFWTEDSPWIAWTSDIDEYKKSLEELQAAYDENQQTLADIKSEWTGVAQAVEDAQNQTVTYDEAVSMATSSAQSALDELTAAYDKAYESARTSIEGQIGLFDTMKTSSELSISDMEKAMQSQTDYLNLYSENLKKAAEYGLDDGLIKSLSDGSEESAGYINAIIQNIEKLGGSTEGMLARTHSRATGTTSYPRHLSARAQPESCAPAAISRRATGLASTCIRSPASRLRPGSTQRPSSSNQAKRPLTCLHRSGAAHRTRSTPAQAWLRVAERPQT